MCLSCLLCYKPSDNVKRKCVSYYLLHSLLGFCVINKNHISNDVEWIYRWRDVVSSNTPWTVARDKANTLLWNSVNISGLAVNTKWHPIHSRYVANWSWVRVWDCLFNCNISQKLWPFEKSCHSYSPETELNITPLTQQELETHHTPAAQN